MIRALLMASAIALIPASASAADLIVNGGFENPYVASSCCSTVPSASLPGWTIPTGNVNVVNGTFSSSAGNLAFEGSQYLDLVGEGGVGSLAQSFNTTVGQAYSLSFAFSHNLFAGLSSASASLSVGDWSDVITHTGGSNADLAWQNYTHSFVATDTTTTLNFTNLTGAGNEGVFLDAVSVNAAGINPTGAVPEPSTWAMMLLGFGAVGFSLRRRKAQAPRLRVAYA
jgi:choice-of-anchor C domain-containing protein